MYATRKKTSDLDTIIAYCGTREVPASTPGVIERKYAPEITDGSGNVLGHYSVVSSRKAPLNHYVGTRIYNIRATINGRKYHGVTYGPGVSVRLRPYKNQEG